MQRKTDAIGALFDIIELSKKFWADIKKKLVYSFGLQKATVSDILGGRYSPYEKMAWYKINTTRMDLV